MQKSKNWHPVKAGRLEGVGARYARDRDVYGRDCTRHWVRQTLPRLTPSADYSRTADSRPIERDRDKLYTGRVRVAPAPKKPEPKTSMADALASVGL